MANGSELVPELNPALPSGTNPLEGLREIAARPQFTPEETAEYERPDLITGGLRAGLYSTVGAGAEAVGLPGVSDFLSRRAAANAPKLNDYRDIHSAEDLIRYGLGTGATAIGSTLPTLIPGLGLGGLAGRAALSLRAAAPAVRAARTVGSAAGAYGAALPMEMGEVLLEAKAKGMDTNDATIRQVAWDKALINAALEAALPAMLGGKLLKGVRPSIRRTALGSAGVEGTTEGAQEISGIFADSRITGQPVDLSNPDTRARIINSIIGGALGGGGIGTVVGGLEKLGSAQLPSLPSREAQPESTGDVYRDAEGNEERSTTNLYRDADEEVERMFDTSVPPSGPPPGGAGAAVFKEEAPAQVDAGAYIADVMRRAGDFRNPEHRATFLSSAAAKLASMSDSVKGWAKGVAQIITDRSNMVQQPRQQLDLFADQPDAVAAFISGAAWAPRSITDLPGTLQFMANPNNRAQATRYIYEGLPAEDRAQITNPDFNDIATQATVGRMYAGRIAKERVQRVNGIIGRVRAAMPDTRQGRLFSEELNQEDLNLSATIADKMRSIMSANMMTAMATKGPAGQRAERVVEGMRERTAKA
ncbi:MAG: hypothetical protein ACREJC_02040, partial [Tepidisphaeraceae bacterium]